MHIPHLAFDAFIGTVFSRHFAGQKIFKRSLRNSDAFSETSSVSHCEDLEKTDQRPPALSPGQEQRSPETENPEQQQQEGTQTPPKGTEDIPRDCTKVEEQESQR